MASDIVRRSLVVNLTEQEITDCSKELARVTTLQAEIEEEKKTVTSSFKEKLDRCISESRSLARKISTQQDFREVECEWQFDFDRRKKRLIRLDTFAEVEERKLTADELQEELNFNSVSDPGIECPPVCPKCDGDDEYYEDGVDGGGGQVYCDCAAGQELEVMECDEAVEQLSREVKRLVNTSADDLKTSLHHATDPGVLREALSVCVRRGEKTKIKHIAARLKQFSSGEAV